MEATSDSVTELRQYVSSLPHDSYSVCNYRYSSEKQDMLFEVQEQHGGKRRVRLKPLVGFPKTFREAALPEFEEVSTDVDDAKRRIAERVLMKLKQTVELLDVPHRQMQDSPKQNLAGKGGYWVRGTLLKDLRERFELQWPESPVSLFVVETDLDESWWGLLTTSPAEYSYQLCIDNVKLRLEVSSDSEKIGWKPEELANVLKFHHLALCRQGKQHQLEELLYVKVRGGGIDYAAMRQPPSNLPDWLPGLHRHMDRKLFWELIATQVPVEPAPNPLKLEKIFDEPHASQKEEFARDLQCMAAVGKSALRLSAVVAESSQDPSQSRESLSRKVERYLDPCAPHLLIKTGLIDLGTRKEIATVGEVCEMFYALMGAHQLEGDAFSVLRLWEWFIALSNKGLSSADKYKGLEESARDYVIACPRYLGRTPSYLEFGEVDPDDCEKDVPGPYLRVRYEDSDDAIYRWRRGVPEEKRPELSDAWKPLFYDYVCASFCSPTMRTPGRIGEARARPLPNKLCAWLRGRSARKLVVIKHCPEQTPPYDFLREEEQEETDGTGMVVPTTYLYVRYATLEHDVCYRRSPRGLGEEYFEGKKYILSYSECKKSLVSGVMPGWACPRKVANWLLENRSLSSLIPGRRKGRKGDVERNESGVTILTPGTAEFSQNGETVKVRAAPIPDVEGYFIYQYSTDAGKTWQALTYAEARKEWVRLTRDSKPESYDDGIPFQAIAAITPSEEASVGTASSLKTPSWVARLFPSGTGTTITEIEQQIDHRFKRSQLLAEALMHYSTQSRDVNSNGHLALVGEIVMEQYVWVKAVKEAKFFGSHVVVTHKETQPLPTTFATPKGLPLPRASLAIEENPGGVDNDTALTQRIWACCNHVNYAAKSVVLELHKTMNQDSVELKTANKRFAQQFAKVSQQKDRWRRLFELGAPKALGDLFLAVIGAITMDSDCCDAEALMQKHYEESERIFEILQDGKFGIPEHTLLSTNGLLQLQRDFPEGYCEKILDADTPSQLCLSRELADGLDWKTSLHTNDVCMVKVEEASTSREVIGSTPRSLLIHLGFQRERDGCQENELDVEWDGDQLDAEESDTDKNQPFERDGAIFCKHCQMWLNGPAQWADHEIGKKHRKAVRRQQAERNAGQFATVPRSTTIPAPPAGFGKKTYEKGSERSLPEDTQSDLSQGGGSVSSEQQDLHPIEQQFGDTEGEAAIYCKVCDMWLNGPTQRADHEIGRKHRKAARRAAGDEIVEPINVDQSAGSQSWLPQWHDDAYSWTPQFRGQRELDGSYAVYAWPGSSPPPNDFAYVLDMDFPLQ